MNERVREAALELAQLVGRLGISPEDMPMPVSQEDAERWQTAELESDGFLWEDNAPLSEIALSPTYEGDVPFVFYYCRLRQNNGQMAWSSPIWFHRA